MLFPEPLGPTSARMDPFGTSKETSWMAGSPSLYANETRSNTIRSSKRVLATAPGASRMPAPVSRNSKTRSAATSPG